MFQSTRPMRGATQWLRADLDLLYVSIHAPHAGRDTADLAFTLFEAEFQSTRPMRGATCKVSTCSASGKSFNPRAPCGARLWRGFLLP